MRFESPWLKLEMVAEKKASIDIFGFIGVPEWWQHDEEMAEKVVTTKEKMRSELKQLAELKASEIEVNIDSFGGDVNHGLAIYNALAMNDAKITVNYVGWSASIATVIAAAGDVVNAPNNFIGLLHEARGAAYGTIAEIEAYNKWLGKVNHTAANIYAIKAKGEHETFLSVMGENNGEGEWRSAEELQALGLIDNVIEPMKAVASAEEFKTRAKEFGLNTNNLNMGLFNKDTKKVNSIMLGETSAIYDGELKAGVKLLGVGADLVDGSFDVEGKTLVVENSILKSITPIETEMIDAATAASMVADATAPIQAKLDEANKTIASMTAEQEDLQTRYDNLASLSSTHKPEKKQEIANEKQPVGELSMSDITKTVKEIGKETSERLNKKRRGE